MDAHINGNKYIAYSSFNRLDASVHKTPPLLIVAFNLCGKLLFLSSRRVSAVPLGAFVTERAVLRYVFLQDAFRDT